MNHRPESPLALTQGSISNSADIDYVIWCKASIKRESTPNSGLHLKLDLLAIVFLAGTAKSRQNQISHRLKLLSASLILHAACRCICAAQMTSHLQPICSVLAGAFSVVPIQSGSRSSLSPSRTIAPFCQTHGDEHGAKLSDPKLILHKGLLLPSTLWSSK